MAIFPAGSTTCTARASLLGLHALSARVRGPRRPLTLPPGPHPPQERGVAHVQERKKMRTAHRKFSAHALPVGLEAGMPLALRVTVRESRNGMSSCCYEFRFSGDSFKMVSPDERQGALRYPQADPGGWRSWRRRIPGLHQARRERARNGARQRRWAVRLFFRDPMEELLETALEADGSVAGALQGFDVAGRPARCSIRRVTLQLEAPQ